MKKRTTYVLAGLMSLALVAITGSPVAAGSEVCVTPPMLFNTGDFINCDIVNAFQYSSMLIQKVEIVNGAGQVIFVTPPDVTLGAAQGQATIHEVPAAALLYCRWTLITPLAGYVRALIARTVVTVPPQPLVPQPGPVAECTPF